MEPTTDVIFRKWRDGNVIALFPGTAATNDPHLCLSYEHMGQHAAASDSLTGVTDPAKPAEYVELKRELERQGYNLNVVRRFTSKHRQQRRAQCERVLGVR